MDTIHGNWGSCNIESARICSVPIAFAENTSSRFGIREYKHTALQRNNRFEQ